MVTPAPWLADHSERQANKYTDQQVEKLVKRIAALESKVKDRQSFDDGRAYAYEECAEYLEKQELHDYAELIRTRIPR
jgi:hypothetical protein